MIFDLEAETHMPYMKPGNHPLYVSSMSNHPPSILKNIPEAINRRLSTISGDKKIFENAAPTYQAELDRDGCKHKLSFNPQIDAVKKKRIMDT